MRARAGFLAAMFVAASALATPRQITYQGRLEGLDVVGTVDIDFAIFDEVTGGDVLWTESHSVELWDGVFTVRLGSESSEGISVSVFEDPDLFLEVSVWAGGADPIIFPRRQLTSAPFAFRAFSADDAELLAGQPAAAYALVSDLADGTPTTVPVTWNDLTSIPSDLADGAVSWGEIGGIPSALADGAVSWGEIGGIPADIADGDANTTYGSGAGLALSGTTFSLDSAGCEVGAAWSWSGSAWSCDPPASTWASSGTNAYSTNSGNVGVGTSSPSSKLHVVGRLNVEHVASGSDVYAILFGGECCSGGDTGIGHPGDGSLSFWSNGGEAIRINDSGERRVGIGTSTPTTRLDVNGVATAKGVNATSGDASGWYAFRGSLPNNGFNLFGGYITGDAEPLIRIRGWGAVEFGPGGSVAPDVSIGRQGTGGMIVHAKLAVDPNSGSGVTPVGPLHVAGLNDTASVVAFMPGSDTGAAGTPSLKVGIGTTSPSNTLGVVGTVGATGTITQLTSADLAENITASDPGIKPGDVVAVDPRGGERIVLSSRPYETSLVGVISEAPGFLLNGAPENLHEQRPVALAGRVPVKVTSEGGPIRPGDLLTSSSTPGYAMRATEPWRGGILGVALTTPSRGRAVVLVAKQLAPALDREAAAAIEELRRENRQLQRVLEDLSVRMATLESSSGTRLARR